MAEFIREDSLPVVANMSPNEVRVSDQPSVSFVETNEQLMILPLRVDKAGRDIRVGFQVERFTGSVWTAIDGSLDLTVLQPDIVSANGTLRLRIRVEAGPLGALGGFDASALIIIMAELGSEPPA